MNKVTQAFRGIPFTPAAGCPAITTCEEYVDPGNPYYFTGRRLDVLERDADGSITGHEAEPMLTLYHYRARGYDADHGRFIQRDPAGYVDSMNLYEYAGSNPIVNADPTGKWGQDVHLGLTDLWATESGMSAPAALAVARFNDGTDGLHTGFLPIIGDQWRHFDRSAGGRDTRLIAMDREFKKATLACDRANTTIRNDRRRFWASNHLGKALHSIQDWWAHGDYSKGPSDTAHAHLSKYDDWIGHWDANPADSIDGRAPQRFDFTIDGGSVQVTRELRYEGWVHGTKRNSGTERDSKRLISRFIDSLRNVGHCTCETFFLRREDGRNGTLFD